VKVSIEEKKKKMIKNLKVPIERIGFFGKVEF
jgi:hypothetical protein